MPETHCATPPPNSSFVANGVEGDRPACRPPHSWTHSEQELIRRHYGPQAPEPVPTKQLAKRLGVSVKALWKEASRLGVSRHPPCLAIHAVALARLSAQGLSMRAMARALGLHHNTVKRWLAELAQADNPEEKE